MTTWSDDSNSPPAAPHGSNVQQGQAAQGLLGMLARRYDLALVEASDIVVPFDNAGNVTNSQPAAGSTIPMTGGGQRDMAQRMTREQVLRDFPSAASRLR